MSVVLIKGSIRLKVSRFVLVFMFWLFSLCILIHKLIISKSQVIYLLSQRFFQSFVKCIRIAISYFLSETLLIESDFRMQDLIRTWEAHRQTKVSLQAGFGTRAGWFDKAIELHEWLISIFIFIYLGLNSDLSMIMISRVSGRIKVD